jgi:hypothetical protein
VSPVGAKRRALGPPHAEPVRNSCGVQVMTHAACSDTEASYMAWIVMVPRPPATRRSASRSATRRVSVTVRPGSSLPSGGRWPRSRRSSAAVGRHCRSPLRRIRLSGHSGTSPWWSLEGVEAEDRAGQQDQGIEPLGVSLIADPQPPEATQPGPGPFDGPAVTAQPLRRLDHAPGDPGADATSAEVAAAAAMVVGLVGVDLGWPAPSAAGGHADRWDVV